MPIDTMQCQLLDGATLPTRGTPGSAGFDLHLSEEIAIPAGHTRIARTGLCIALPPRSVGYIHIRSSWGVEGLNLANTVGVIDADYRGEIKLALRNQSALPIHIRKGSRVAQLVIHPIITPEPHHVDFLPQTSRGTGGFGSTGGTP